MHSPVPLPGDLVWIRRRRWRVERVRRDRHVVCLDVAARDRTLTFLAPFDRVFAAAGAKSPRRVRPQQALARLARVIATAGDVRVPSALVSAHADILPYQLEPAMAMLAGSTRVLLADEVGLGKTIQAGLVIAELARRDATVRVIILTPASLRDQWHDELRHRFALDGLTADRAGLDALSRAGAFGDSPWDRPGIWLASPDFLKQRHVLEAMPRAPWDLIVIDEAHNACGDSDRYELVHQLARRSRRVLLLTATPHSGDATRFDRLMNIGRIDDSQPPLLFRRTRSMLGQRPPRRVRWHQVRLSGAEANVLSALRAFELAVLTRSQEHDRALILLSVLRKRALSSMWALSQSVSRRLAWLGDLGPDSALDWAQPRLSFGDETEPAEDEERHGLTAQTGLPEKQERSWLRRIRGLAEDAAREERKIGRLLALIRRSREPVVVFTEFRDSLDAIRRRLPFDRPASILHGGQNAIERRTQLKLFLDGTTSVLLATDVAGQGLNLQSRARWVISLELPWNPARLEQRIGRVDRISQTKPTHFTLLVARHEAEAGLLAHLSRRVLTARQSIGDDILASVAPPEETVRLALLYGNQNCNEATTTSRSTEAPADDPARPRHSFRSHHGFIRLARIAALSLSRRRALTRMWQAPESASRSGVVCRHPRLARLVPCGFRSVFVFSVPVLDGADALVDRIIVAIGARASQKDTDACHLGAAAEALIPETLRRRAIAVAKRRIKSIARKQRRAIETLTVRDLAIADSLAREFDDRELQPGLFDGRDVRSFEIDGSETAEAQRDAERAIQRTALTADIRVGVPMLELVVSRDR